MCNDREVAQSPSPEVIDSTMACWSRGFAFLLTRGLLVIMLIWGPMIAILPLPPKATLAELLIIIGLPFGFASASLATLSLILFQRIRPNLPREISVGSKNLVVHVPEGTIEIPLSTIAWYVGRSSEDPYYWFSVNRKAVVVFLRNQRFALGVRDGDWRQWRDYLRSLRVAPTRRAGWAHSIALVLVSPLVGGTLGYAVGSVLGRLLGIAEPVVILPVINGMQGVFLAATYIDRVWQWRPTDRPINVSSWTLASVAVAVTVSLVVCENLVVAGVAASLTGLPTFLVTSRIARLQARYRTAK